MRICKMPQNCGLYANEFILKINRMATLFSKKKKKIVAFD